MGTKERRLRERAVLKENIILAAKQIAASDGWNAVTMRKIADKIEYSPPMIYEYFEDKEALICEIRREGYQKLLMHYQQTLQTSQDPVAVLTKLGEAYWDFAWENQALYKIMYGLEGVSVGIKGLEKEIEQIRLTVKETLIRVLKNAEDYPHRTKFDWENAIDILRSMLHGVITFAMLGGLHGDHKRAHALAMQGVENLVTHWMKNHD